MRSPVGAPAIHPFSAQPTAPDRAGIYPCSHFATTRTTIREAGADNVHVRGQGRASEVEEAADFRDDGGGEAVRNASNDTVRARVAYGMVALMRSASAAGWRSSAPGTMSCTTGPFPHWAANRRVLEPGTWNPGVPGDRIERKRLSCNSYWAQRGNGAAASLGTDYRRGGF